MTRPLLRLPGALAQAVVDRAKGGARARDAASSGKCTTLVGHRGSRACGFTLLEVMIAAGIFFMATFAILALVAGTIDTPRPTPSKTSITATCA